jgi:hypothetical protein
MSRQDVVTSWYAGASRLAFADDPQLALLLFPAPLSRFPFIGYWRFPREAPEAGLLGGRGADPKAPLGRRGGWGLAVPAKCALLAWRSANFRPSPGKARLRGKRRKRRFSFQARFSWRLSEMRRLPSAHLLWWRFSHDPEIEGSALLQETRGLSVKRGASPAPSGRGPCSSVPSASAEGEAGLGRGGNNVFCDYLFFCEFTALLRRCCD